jgi:hypothetical protein
MQQQQQGTVAGMLYLRRQKHHQQGNRRQKNTLCGWLQFENHVSTDVYARLRFYRTTVVTSRVGRRS